MQYTIHGWSRKWQIKAELVINLMKRGNDFNETIKKAGLK